MSFISLTFVIFLILVVPLYYIVPFQYRWIFLLIISYIFYSFARLDFFIYLAFVTISTFCIALYIEKLNRHEKSQKLKKFWLALALILNLGIIIFFKFSNFVVTNFNYDSNLIPNINFLILPLGLSFYTFQALSYVIDVYKKKIKAETNIAKYALFISFFPQFIMGPISRYQELNHQFYQRYIFDKNRFVYGIQRIILGFFKKIVVADRLAIFIEHNYLYYNDCSGFVLLITTLLYSFQVYADFSSYMDIAVGVANCLGIDIQENFKSPFFSKSMKEFWTRWHITLGTWFRDYVYIPLGGSRVNKFRHIFNIIFVWFFVGLWHGFTLNFIAFGLAHGIIIIITIYLGRYISSKYKFNSKIFDIINMFMVFFIFSIFNIFPRIPNIYDGLKIIKKIFTDMSCNGMFAGLTTNFFDISEWIVSVLSIIFLLIIDYLYLKNKLRNISIKSRLLLAYFLLVCILIFGKFGNTTFIYFEF